MESTQPTPVKRLAVLAGMGLFWFAVAGLGGWLTAQSVSTWYPTLAKPAFNPPAWVFGPVWTTLYLLLALGGWLIWQRRQGQGPTETDGLFWPIYWLNGLLNVAWSLTFFTLQSIPGGMVIILLVVLAALALVWLARDLAPRLAWIFAPYLAWVSWASVLNLNILLLNGAG